MIKEYCEGVLVFECYGIMNCPLVDLVTKKGVGSESVICFCSQKCLSQFCKPVLGRDMKDSPAETVLFVDIYSSAAKNWFSIDQQPAHLNESFFGSWR